MKTSLIDKRDTNFVPLLLLAILALQGLTGLCLVGQWLSVHRLSKKQLAYVQMTSGEVLALKAVNADARTPETIRLFVSKTLYLMFNWSGEIAGADGKKIPDKGQEIELEGERIKVPTAALYASYGFSEELRQPLLKKISEIVPQGVFGGGGTQAILTIDHVSIPKEIASGSWEVHVVAQHRLMKGSSTVKVVSFNKKVYVQSLTAPFVAGGDTPLERTVYSVRKSGLEIYQMDELK